VLETRDVKLADGSRAARRPVEEMDLILNPRDRTIDVNPESPNIATVICKRAA
jgi:hypothetical protein